MSDTPLIRFDGVWKRFRRGERHDSLRDFLPSLVRRKKEKAADTTDAGMDNFWAVRDVSFRIEPGEVLGIIGNNGAGKSTCLKMLSRILRPTSGVYEVRGRIGSLVEVAAGFHPDLTGRENVFLQGAIMGMPATMIRRRFDEIIDFSGVADFLDTPVARYSSGMNARLGFAIAAYLDPDVLIIDEVLAVGDTAFQKRAFGRIGELARSGIPVAIVSHQLDRVAQLATQVAVLERGSLIDLDMPTAAISRYLERQQTSAETYGNASIKINAIAADRTRYKSGDRAVIQIDGHCGDQWVGTELVAVRVRNAESSDYLFYYPIREGLATFKPGEPFQLVIEIGLNVNEGALIIESFVYSELAGYEVAGGPLAFVHVEGGAKFRGVVQMNPVVHSPRFFEST